MSKSNILKIKKYLKTTKNCNINNHYITDESGAIYFCNAISIIKLFDTAYNRKQRAEIVETFKKASDSYNKQVLTFFKNFEDARPCIPAKKHGEMFDTYYKRKLCFFGDNNRCFDIKEINKIINIVGTAKNVTYYNTEDDDRIICIIGKNGIAFLLGCTTY